MSETSPDMSARRSLLTIGKVLVSVALIGAFLLFGKIDMAEIGASLVRIRPAWLLAAAALHVVGLLLSAMRWRQLLLAQDMRVELTTLFKFYLVGGFFNTFLPGRVGGDVVRIYDTAKIKKSGVEPLAVVLIERGSGVLTLLSFAAIVLLLGLNVGFETVTYAGRFWVSFCFVLLLLTSIMFFLHERIALRLIRLLDRGRFAGIAIRLERMYRAVVIYREKPGYLIRALAAGLCLQVNYIIHYYFVARALGIDHVSIAFFFFAIPIRAVLLMVPFFINGIGLRESIDMFFFDKVGITASGAVAFSWLSFLLILCYGLVGGIIYVTRHKDTAP